MARTPRDRHPDDGCRIAHDKWWSEVSRQGDPIRRPNLAGEAFEAGWTAAMTEAMEARRFVENIQDDERRQRAEDKVWQEHFDGFGKPLS
jgi:hypothetical protein